ncbi:MAG: hypothetical protein WCV80_01715 [Candidatus Paceibacterota bacterium]|jgi:hypothetical protein
MEKHYNIHNFLSIKISSDSADILNGYDHYIRHFFSPEERDSEYEVADFKKLSAQNLVSRVGEFVKIKNGICFPEKKYAISFDYNKVCEYTEYANQATNLLIQTILLKKGLSFVHSAGIEIGGKGIIFPALGGVGKTILMSALRGKEDFKFFGDDYVIVSALGEMYSYPSDFSIYPYHIPLFPELKKLAGGAYLRKRTLFGLFYKTKQAINFLAKKAFGLGHPLLKGWSASYAKVPVRELISDEKIGKKTNLAASIFLERYSGEEMIIDSMSIDVLVNKIIGILNLEFGEGMYYCSALAAFGEFNLVEFQLKQKEILFEAFSRLKLYRVRIPISMTPQEYCGRMEEQLRYVIKES